VRRDGAEIKEIVSLGEVRRVIDVLRVGQTVLILTDTMLLAVDLQNGHVSTVQSLPPAYMMGAMITRSNQERVIVSPGFGTEPSDGGIILAYNPAIRTVETLATLDDFSPYTTFLRPVGLTDFGLLYAFPPKEMLSSTCCRSI